MTVVRINRFNSRYDNKVWPLEVHWGDFCALLMNGHLSAKDKADAPMFNAAQYKSLDELKSLPDALVYDKNEGVSFVRRTKANIVEVTLLVLDYDGGMSIAEAKQRFKSVEYIGYTSFSHLQDKKTEKFRLIIRLAEPIPAWCKVDEYDRPIEEGDWYELIDSLKAFAGPCDAASFNPNQIYYMPAAHPKRMDAAQVWMNPGNPLHWRGFARREARKTGPVSHKAGSLGAPKRSDRVLLPNQMLNTRDGPIRVGDIQGKIEGVWCPFHTDRNGSEFARRVAETGNVFLYCKTCDESFFMRRYEEPEPEPETPAQVPTFDDFFDVPDLPRIGKFTDAADTSKVREQLRKIGLKILTHRKPIAPGQIRSAAYPSHLIYLPEGAGKSRLALDLAVDGEKVIFACKSWAQAFEKFDSFRYYGKPLNLEVRMFLSKDGKARRRFGIPVVRKKGDKPFKVGPIDDEATIQAFIAANPKLSPAFIRLSWRFFGPDHMGSTINTAPVVPEEDDDELEEIVTDEMSDDDLETNEVVNVAENANIIVTTFAQLRILKLKKQSVPRDWLIWFDDPDISDVIDIERHDPKKHGSIDQRNRERGLAQINGRWYYIRDQRQSLGRAFKNNKCVYTTTEIITKQAIERLMKKRQEYFVVHDKMEGIAGGKITILGTDKVYKFFDGIIPLLARRLNKQGLPVRLIADGLSQELNHSNSKGKNTLTKQNILVELSVPHPSEVQTVCDALGRAWQTENQGVRRDMMLDRMHQAIGRNRGYRDEGKECVILTDKKLHGWLKRETRYLVDMQNSVVIDRTAGMARKDRRTTKGATELVEAIESFLNNLDDYMQDGRKVFSDVDFVMASITDPTKRTLYAARLLVALTGLSDIRFDSEDEPQSSVEKAYHRVGRRILENWVDPGSLETVMGEYRSIRDPKTGDE